MVVYVTDYYVLIALIDVKLLNSWWIITHMKSRLNNKYCDIIIKYLYKKTEKRSHNKYEIIRFDN